MISSLIRPDLVNLKPYTGARHLYQGEGALLDANENAFGSIVEGPFGLALHRYPDPFAGLLREALSKYLQVPGKKLFLGVGSDEIIDLLIRLFVSPDEEVLIFEPTYGMYRVAAEISGVNVRTALLDSNFQIDFSELEKSLTPKTKIVFCCSPNNPTGNLLKEESIGQLCKSFKGMVVVDEAYIEFASKPSLQKKFGRFENLVLLRTFSKAWGLAGARIGYALASPVVVDYLNKIKPPYNLNSISVALAVRALKKKKRLLSWRGRILKERERLSSALYKLGFNVYPSEANFVLVQHPLSSSLARKLARNFKIVVRDVSEKPGLRDSLRITVGTPAENQRLISALEQIR